MAAQEEKESLLREETGAEMLKGSETEMKSCEKKESKLVLYHWTQSFSSQKVNKHENMTQSTGIEEVIEELKKSCCVYAQWHIVLS